MLKTERKVHIMSVPDRSIDPRILESGKKEFLEKGFEKASLKNICERAGVTTGALYKRYEGKEGLFCAVVEDTLKDLELVTEKKSAVDPGALSDEELIRSWDMDEHAMEWWFDYLEKRREGFVILLRGAAGTKYADFPHDWVQRITEATYGYYEEAYRRGLTKKKVSREEMHIMLTAFWTTIYEPFIHDFSKEKIREFNRSICQLFNWHRVLGFPEK